MTFSIQQISDVSNQATLRNILNILVRQLSDHTGQITLEVGSESTTIMNPKIIDQSKILLIPRTQNASLNKYYIGTIGAGFAEITHDYALANTTFDYVILGSL